MSKSNPLSTKTLSNTYDFTNTKSFENIYLIDNVLDIMMVRKDIILAFGKFKCYKNTDIIYNNRIIVSFTIKYNDKIILNMVSDSDIFFIFYVWLNLNKKNRYLINNIIIKGFYYDWVRNVIENNE
jgi:queuine/archaeosine tRNA-ribosyltransferase